MLRGFDHLITNDPYIVLEHQGQVQLTKSVFGGGKHIFNWD